MIEWDDHEAYPIRQLRPETLSELAWSLVAHERASHYEDAMREDEFDVTHFQRAFQGLEQRPHLIGAQALQESRSGVGLDAEPAELEL